jgi:hypothetical protein
MILYAVSPRPNTFRCVYGTVRVPELQPPLYAVKPHRRFDLHDHQYISSLFEKNRKRVTWDLVFCPLTGSPIACLFPRYVPVSFNRLISASTCRRRSFSIFIFVSVALISRICLLASSPTRQVLWRWCFARRREDVWEPMPKNVSRAFYKM